MIALSVHILKALGLANFKLKINSLGTVEDKEKLFKLLREQLKPELSHLCDDCQQRFTRNVFRILDCKNAACKGIVAKLKLSNQHLSQESLGYFEQVQKNLEELEISFEASPTLVRGLDYYNHTVFEISDASLGSQDALGAGGRYNNLVQELGGPQADAIGFALGIERILLANDQQQAASQALDIFIVALDDNALKAAFGYLAALRRKFLESKEHFSADMSYRLASMKSQMRLADKKGARHVVILGENEIKQGAVTIKEMKTGKQEQFSINEISSVVEMLMRHQKGN